MRHPLRHLVDPVGVLDAVEKAHLLPSKGDVTSAGPEVADLNGQLVGDPAVIGVEEGHQVPIGRSQAQVASSRWPGSVLVENHDLVTLGGECGRGTVGRPIVDHDHLQFHAGWQRLGRHALHRLGQQRTAVVDRNHHRYQCGKRAQRGIRLDRLGLCVPIGHGAIPADSATARPNSASRSPATRSRSRPS